VAPKHATGQIDQWPPMSITVAPRSANTQVGAEALITMCPRTSEIASVPPP
jgi:hypothetical protein